MSRKPNITKSMRALAEHFETSGDLTVSYNTLFPPSKDGNVPEEQSIFSPAAYLVDLIRFIKNKDNIVSKEFDSYEDIKVRRPDLGEIVLCNSETNNVIPKIDIVNTVLKELVPEESCPESTGKILETILDGLGTGVNEIRDSGYVAGRGVMVEIINDNLLKGSLLSIKLSDKRVSGIPKYKERSLNMDVLSPHDQLIIQGLNGGENDKDKEWEAVYSISVGCNVSIQEVLYIWNKFKVTDRDSLAQHKISIWGFLTWVKLGKIDLNGISYFFDDSKQMLTDTEFNNYNAGIHSAVNNKKLTHDVRSKLITDTLCTLLNVTEPVLDLLLGFCNIVVNNDANENRADANTSLNGRALIADESELIKRENVEKLVKMIYLLKLCNINEAELELMKDFPFFPNGGEPNLMLLQRLWLYRKCSNMFNDNTYKLLELIKIRLRTTTWSENTYDKVIGKICDITAWDKFVVMNMLASDAIKEWKSVDDVLCGIVDTCNLMDLNSNKGINLINILEIKQSKDSISVQTVDSLIENLKKHEKQTGNECKISGKVAEATRNAYIKVLLCHKSTNNEINNFRGNRDEFDEYLYGYLLIDPNIKSTVTTSKVVEASEVMQLYVQRCLMGLETSKLTEKGKLEWSWMKQFQLWKANRKVFAYPENYLQPELRGNKTSAFNNLQTNMQKSNLTSSDIDNVFKKYLDELVLVENIHVTGMCCKFKQGYPDRLDVCLVGCNSTAPYHYHYRIGVLSFDSESKEIWDWQSWESLDFSIQSPEVKPQYDDIGRLFMFWVEHVKGENKEQSADSGRNNMQSNSAIKFSYQKSDSSWTSPKVNILSEGSIISYNIYINNCSLYYATLNTKLSMHKGLDLITKHQFITNTMPKDLDSSLKQKEKFDFIRMIGKANKYESKYDDQVFANTKFYSISKTHFCYYDNDNKTLMIFSFISSGITFIRSMAEENLKYVSLIGESSYVYAIGKSGHYISTEIGKCANIEGLNDKDKQQLVFSAENTPVGEPFLFKVQNSKKVDKYFRFKLGKDNSPSVDLLYNNSLKQKSYCDTKLFKNINPNHKEFFNAFHYGVNENYVFYIKERKLVVCEIIEDSGDLKEKYTYDVPSKFAFYDNTGIYLIGNSSIVYIGAWYLKDQGNTYIVDKDSCHTFHNGKDSIIDGPNLIEHENYDEKNKSFGVAIRTGSKSYWLDVSNTEGPLHFKYVELNEAHKILYTITEENKCLFTEDDILYLGSKDQTQDNRLNIVNKKWRDWELAYICSHNIDKKNYVVVQTDTGIIIKESNLNTPVIDCYQQGLFSFSEGYDNKCHMGSFVIEKNLYIYSTQYGLELYEIKDDFLKYTKVNWERLDNIEPTNKKELGKKIKKILRMMYLKNYKTLSYCDFAKDDFTQYQDVVNELSKSLFSLGIEGLLAPKNQLLSDNTSNKSNKDLFDNQISFNAVYYWELFFYAPLLIANHYSTHSQFELAQQWYHYVFYPFVNMGNRNTDFNYWVFQGLKTPVDGKLIDDLKNKTELAKYHDDPFDPHAIANLRPIAYQKSVVVKYIKNLLQWGDAYFIQDTEESLASAKMMYMLARDLIGSKPMINNKATDLPKSMTIDEIESNSKNRDEEFYIHADDGKMYFSIPNNETIQQLWDILKDRLEKLRDSKDIKGNAQKVSLFAPAIDPTELVLDKSRAKGRKKSKSAKGGTDSIYRYSYLIDKAKNTASGVIQFGQSLLNSLEKQDVEELNRMQHNYESVIDKLQVQVKSDAVKVATDNLDQLIVKQTQAKNSIKYYSNLLSNEGFNSTISSMEQGGLALNSTAAGMSSYSIVLNQLAAPSHLIPTIYGVADGGFQPGSALQAQATVYDGIANGMNQLAGILNTTSGYLRRKEEWLYQKNCALSEKEQVEKEVDVARLNLQMSQKELSMLTSQIEQRKDINAFIKNKFSNKELYQWITSNLSNLYSEYYNLALELAYNVQHAYEKELCEVTGVSYINPIAWNSLYQGLFAGEGLMIQLHQMENDYLLNNKYIEGQCIIKGKPKAGKTNEWEFSLNDIMDNTIKSFSVDIPGVLSPYNTIKGNLIYNNEKINVNRGLNNNGIFSLNYDPNRYMPFEYQRITNDNKLVKLVINNSKDFASSIRDVVLNVTYIENT